MKLKLEVGVGRELYNGQSRFWIPAFAGMTVNGDGMVNVGDLDPSMRWGVGFWATPLIFW
ncbi:MAG: hypothetical protein GX629_02385 [Phycisphaerae bacterium]|nr:hypothetical protein [Phycisphaerae bacterium]